MMVLNLDPEVEAALLKKAAVSEGSVDEIASLILSRIMLEE